MEDNDFISTTNIDIHVLWQNAMEEISKNISIFSFDVWIKSLEVVDIRGNTIILSTSTKDTKARLLKNYKDSIISACNKFYSAITNLEIIVKDDEIIAEQENKKSVEENKPEKKTGFRFDPKYTFDNYIVGNNNDLATAAALAVAKDPTDKKTNPLFIYGGSGLGKTHLLFAIGNYISEHRPEQNVVYVTTYKFVNDFTTALQNHTINEFKEPYNNADVLIIDDIQGIINKVQTQEQFFNIFNELYQSGKQIIITSDKQPKELVPLEERLRSRFEWGLTADIGVPDTETRIAILNKKAQLERFNVSREVIEYIAELSTTNVREMEGYLQRVVFYSGLKTQGIVTKQYAMEALKDIAKDDKETIDATKIIEIVCKFYGIKKEDILAKKRTKVIAEARQVAMYLISEYINIPLDAIGNIFGKDHSTVIYAKNKILDDMKASKKLEVNINDMKHMIEGK